MMLANEKKLIKDLKNKNEKAFETIYYAYNHLLHFIVIQIVKNKEATEDIVNDTFMTMYLNINQHDEEKNFKYWLISIAKNKAYQYLKTTKIINTYLNNDYINHQASHNDDTWMIVETCKKILTDIEYNVLVLHVIYELKFVDVAAIMQISKSEAHRIYQRSIKKVKREMR